MDLLNVITGLSHEFGTEEYVKGGGGNTSAKTADTLWVKPSGTTLAGLAPESFVAMSRARLRELYAAVVPKDPAARESLVKDMMAAAVLPGQTGRPSVEAPLHDLLDARFVVHTHPALVNGMTCSLHGAAACARLFPEALWIPYIDPGYTLCMDVRRRVGDHVRSQGRQPRLLVLENHGVFVAGDDAGEIRAAYGRLIKSLRAEYKKAGVSTTLAAAQPAPAAAAQASESLVRELLGSDAAFVTHAPVCSLPCAPLSPDHIVYAKSFPYDEPLTREGLAEFRRRRGYPPRVLRLATGVWAAGPSRKQAELALELALDGALVQQLAAAFGGPQFLSNAAREFIENWEVENYRQAQMK